MVTPGRFTLQEFPLQCGVVLPQVEVVYQVYGELNSRHSNAILYPTSYGAQHTDVNWLVRPGGILDPNRWCVVMVNMFGNGLSTSPSNYPAVAQPGVYFTHYDNVRAQQALVTQELGIDQLALVYGWSMGAQQGYHWGALYPDRVQRIAALCGTAKTTDHNKIFLYSLRAALTSDPTWNGERFEGTPDRGFHTFAQIYASWAASQAYYRAKPYLDWGYDSLEDYILRGWEAGYRQRNPHNLLAMIDTWLRCDVGDNPVYQGDYAKAIGSITAKTLVMPATTDLYFTPEDCKAEAALIPNTEYRPIPSIWGHRAGNPYQNPEDEAFIQRAIAALLTQ
ncbi:alpha/beta fold hydrolase [Nodosilinea sp. FACHB-13]|uniref:alpha/beta fold hydrolase n=2 Tax=Cyanophyceae TaxID=3028117 RepID=UPI001682EA0E|nr:alpha/beta fold hydrolase [Nodosilinea sp. FACHB-13]MBD2107268.1 alpha/beta fold hydrolase [Nodosilinea sp. FACHB-13]